MILLHQRDRTPSGYFRPDATVTVRPALRTSGLLLALPPDDVKSLLLMLTFVTANGWCRPAVQNLPTPCASARRRRGRGCSAWRTSVAGPAARDRDQRESGMDGFALSPAVVGTEQAAPEPPPAPPLPPTAGRDAIIAHSRALYARPRAEVERGIAERMGWGPPAFAGDDPAVAEGKRRGVPADDGPGGAEGAGAGPAGPVRSWSAWRDSWTGCPTGTPRVRPGSWPAAIEHDYEAPPAVRLQQAAGRCRANRRRKRRRDIAETCADARQEQKESESRLRTSRRVADEV